VLQTLHLSLGVFTGRPCATRLFDQRVPWKLIVTHLFSKFLLFIACSVCDPWNRVHGSTFHFTNAHPRTIGSMKLSLGTARLFRCVLCFPECYLPSPSQPPPFEVTLNYVAPQGVRGSVVVKVLCNKPEGRGFEIR
jgi:hypothetical protein